MISNMEKVQKPGKKALHTKATMNLARSREKASTSGPMDHITKAIGYKTKSLVSEHMFGKTAGGLMESGSIMICQAMESITMLTVLSMMVSSCLTKKMASVFTSGPMEEFMKGGGTKENSTDLVLTQTQQRTM